MVETSDDPNSSDRIRSSAHVPTSNRPISDRHFGRTVDLTTGSKLAHNATDPDSGPVGEKISNFTTNTTGNNVASQHDPASPPPAPPPEVEADHGETSATIETEEKQNIFIRFYRTTKEIMLSSIMNILLIFVPVGIAVKFAGVSPNIVFAINAIAIIPLAGLLSHGTESVAASMGDTIGALMNVTFGNAVELIILFVLPEHLHSICPPLTIRSMYVQCTDIKTIKSQRLPGKHLQLNRVPYYLLLPCSSLVSHCDTLFHMLTHVIT